MLKERMTKLLFGAAMVGSVAAIAPYASYADHHEKTDKKMMEHHAEDHHGKGHIMAALKSPDRPTEDKARDEARKPAEVLAFVGVMPGMTVVDQGSGGGWYTEILSRSVGADGHVYAHNDGLYYDFVKDGLDKRYGDNRLPNVTISVGSEATGADAGSVDVVFTALAYHDLFYHPDGKPSPADLDATLAEVKRVLKPGGVYVVMDHVAPAGTGIEQADKTHRIDPEAVKEQVTAAGFELVETSDILANPDDDHTAGVFDPSIRGKTDRFIFKFRKAM